MAIFILVLALIVALLLLYAIFGRAWLKKQPWAARFFAWIEPFEIALYKKSETILVGRLLWVGGFVVTAYDALATFVHSLDITPLTTRVFDYLQIPADMRSLTATAFISIIGLLINRLRNRTTKPIALVAVQEQNLPLVAQAAIADADAAKEQAVAVVKAAA